MASFISIGRFKQWGFASPFNKGSKPKAPDYRPLAEASLKAAEIGAQLGREQLAENRRQYDMNMAVAQPVIDAQLQQMRETGDMARDYYDYQQKTFRPIEEGLAREANDFNTDSAREQFTRSAVSDIAQAQANTQAQNQRTMTGMGINPNSAKFAAVNRQQATMDAAQRAGAATNARAQADSMSWAKRMDVTGLGRGLTGASQGAYGLATQAGNAAVGARNSTSAQYMGGMSAGNGLIMQGQGLRVQGLGNILNSQTSTYNASMNQDDGFSGLIGAGGSMAAAFI